MSRGSALRSLAALGCVTLVAGCAGLPLEDRDWHALHSEHYSLHSALRPEETIALAQSLERFRAATEALAGESLARAGRLRIVAMYLPAPGSPFADPTRVGRSHLLRCDGRVMGFVRTRARLFADVSELPVSFQRDHARLLLERGSRAERPAWMREGIVQLASTIGPTRDAVEIGAPQSEHIERLRSAAWLPLPTLLAVDAPERLSPGRRRLFEAQSWALVHFLRFSPLRPRADAGFDAYLRAWRELGPGPESEARLGEGVQGALQTYVRGEEMLSVLANVEWSRQLSALEEGIAPPPADPDAYCRSSGFPLPQPGEETPSRAEEIARARDPRPASAPHSRLDTTPSHGR